MLLYPYKLSFMKVYMKGERKMFVVNERLSIAVRKKRAVIDLTKSELCELLNLSTVTLRKIESGKGKINKKNI